MVLPDYKNQNKTVNYATTRLFHCRESASLGFTLVEVLIASTIFAVVMTITFAVIAQTSVLQGKIGALKLVSSSTRRLADALTNSIVSAEGGPLIWVNRTFSVSATPQGEYYSSGALTYYCPSTNPTQCVLKNYSQTTIDNASNFLILFSKRNVRTYLTIRDADNNGKVYYYEKNNIDPAAWFNASNKVPTLFTETYNSSNVISDPNFSTSMLFGGYLQSDFSQGSTLLNRNQQPYVKFTIDTRTLNYSSASESSRVSSAIESKVSLRSHHIPSSR